MKTKIPLVLSGWSFAQAAVCAAETPAATPIKPPASRVGIHDSRAVAFAHFWSAARQQKLNERAPPLPLEEARRLDAAGKM